MKKIIAIVTSIILFIGVFFTPIIQDVIVEKIKDINFSDAMSKIINCIKNFIFYEIPIFYILIGLIILIIIQIIIHFTENNKNNKINIKNLTPKEKNTLKKFYIKELNRFRNKAELNNNDHDSIELLIERNILKTPNEFEVINNYTGKGTIYQLTEKAIIILNKNFKNGI